MLEHRIKGEVERGLRRERENEGTNFFGSVCIPKNDAFSLWGCERREAIRKLIELEATKELLIIAQRGKFRDERDLARRGREKITKEEA